MGGSTISAHSRDGKEWQQADDLPALYFDMPSSLSPTVARTSNVAEFDGIEDLKIDLANGSGPWGIRMQQAYACWIKNVTVTKSPSWLLEIIHCLQCEVRHSSFLERTGAGSNGAGIFFQSSSGCLIEDNIITKISSLIQVNRSACGNVFAYNFLYDSTLLGVEGPGLKTNHGPHNSFNLYEGNIAPNVQCDGYYGSTSEDTLFRNWFHGDNPGLPGGWTNRFNRFTRKYSVVGNIFGQSGHDNGYYILGQPNLGNGEYSGEVQPTIGIWWKDWPAAVAAAEHASGNGPGPSGFQEFDLDVAKTMILKGNWNASDNGIPANESLGGQTLPDSLYRSSKPAWFGDRAWPPFNPSSPNQSYEAIPAGYRYARGEDPPAGSGGGSPAASTPLSPPPASPTSTPSGLVAAFGFNEGSGTSVADASGNGNSGAIIGALRTAGKYSGGLSFNGVDNVVVVDSSPSLNFVSEMTLEAWIYPTATMVNWHAILRKETDAWYLDMSGPGETMRPAGGALFSEGDKWVSAPDAIPLTTWTHIATTSDGGTLRLYVNGVQVASRAVSGSIEVNSKPLRIGGSTYAGQFFQGIIDEVRIYNKALTQPEIQADMHTSVPPAPPDNLTIR